MNYASASINPSGEVRLLSVEDTRERLGGICRNTLAKLERNKELTPVRIEKRVFYRSVDIEEFILGRAPISEPSGFLDHLRFMVSPGGTVVGVFFDGAA